MDLMMRDLLTGGGSFGIEYVSKTIPSNMPSQHYHEHYEIFYLLSGERYYFVNDRTYRIKKGDIVLIKANDLHHTVDAETLDYKRILIDFKPDFINGIENALKDVDFFSCFNGQSNVLRLEPQEQTEIEAILFKMLDEYQRGGGSASYLKLLLGELLLALGRLGKRAQDSLFDYPCSIHKKISEAIRYININYAQKMTLEDISERFYISQYYFCRNFKKVTGLTFTQYVNMLRVKQAQLMLGSSRQNISKIGESVGFESQTHFGRVFKRMTGVSPVKYRKAVRAAGGRGI